MTLKKDETDNEYEAVQEEAQAEFVSVVCFLLTRLP